MSLLDKLWDDTVAGPRPDSGLGKLRKPASFSLRQSSDKEEQPGKLGKPASFSIRQSAGKEEMPMDEPKVTRSIMIKKPAGCPSPANTPPSSPAGATSPLSPFSGAREWNRFRRKSSSDAYEQRGRTVASIGPRSASPPHEI